MKLRVGIVGLGGQWDTASILAAARAGAKPGPVSKAEAPPRAAPRVKPTVEKAVAPPPVMPARPVKPEPKAKKGEEEDRRGFLEIAPCLLLRPRHGENVGHARPTGSTGFGNAGFGHTGPNGRRLLRGRLRRIGSPLRVTPSG